MTEKKLYGSIRIKNELFKSLGNTREIAQNNFFVILIQNKTTQICLTLKTRLRGTG